MLPCTALYFKIVSGPSGYLAQFRKVFLFGYGDIVA